MQLGHKFSMKLFYRFTLILFTLNSLAGCSYILGQREAGPLISSPTANKLEAGIGFSEVLDQVISPRCLECHSASRGNAGGINLETYENVFPKLQSIRDDIATSRMPKDRPSLNSQQKELLFAWIDSGGPKEKTNSALPSTPTPAPTPPPIPEPEPAPFPNPVPTPLPTPRVVTFAEVDKKVFQASCVGCHSQAGNNKGGVNLESYPSIFAVRARIQFEVAGGSMPRGGRLTASQKNLVLQWISNGAPE